MKPNAFIGKKSAPTSDELAVALGEAQPVWDELLAELDRGLDVKADEWKSYSPRAGWSLRVKRKARTIVWLGPSEGSFLVAFILGEKALKAARSSKLPSRFLKAIETAPKYPEGTGVRITVKKRNDLPAIMTLAGIKIAN